MARDPLTRFLTELSESPELLQEFLDDRRGVAQRSGVPERYFYVLETGSHEEVHSAVSAEHPAQGDVAAISLPDWWIRSS